jgi:polysaccharide pyruvyl transferase WcaK-like protein
LLHVDNYTTVGERAYEFMDARARELAARTNRPLRRTNNLIESGSESGLQLCLDQYRNSDIVLSSGLHGCIIGVAMGKGVVAVSGDRKIDSFMQSVGLEEWVCPNDDLDGLQARLERATDQPSRLAVVRAIRQVNEEIGAAVQKRQRE